MSYMIYNSDIPDAVLRSLCDPEGPSRKEWRDCNSYWASATDDDIKEVEKKINEMKTDGTLEQFVKDNDKSQGFYKLQMLFAKRIN